MKRALFPERFPLCISFWSQIEFLEALELLCVLVTIVIAHPFWIVQYKKALYFEKKIAFYSKIFRWRCEGRDQVLFNHFSGTGTPLHILYIECKTNLQKFMFHTVLTLDTRRTRYDNSFIFILLRQI